MKSLWKIRATQIREKSMKCGREPTQLPTVWYKCEDDKVSDFSQAMFSSKPRPSGFLVCGIQIYIIHLSFKKISSCL